MAEEGGGAEAGEDGGETSVRVYIRIRPLNRRELGENQVISWQYNKTAMLEETQNGVRVYAYDQVFGVQSTNVETYQTVGKPVVLKAMEGFNGTVFTYGQTGSGKTWTMRGCDADPGMMILCIQDIFIYVDQNKHRYNYKLFVSYLEVYNEEINDLLQTVEGEGKNLKITSEDAARGAVIGTLVEERVNTPGEFMEVLYRGEAARSYASTSMNDNSSRSHVIYRVAIEICELEGAVSAPRDPIAMLMAGGDTGPQSRISYMNLVDLAGSERQKSTNATGKTLKEGANINKSLLALGAVIGKLGSAQKVKKGAKADFIPYRDSKLTRILKQSLGGNTLTSVLVAVSPAGMNREETVSSLKFGQMCKKIKNNVQSNVTVDPQAEVKGLRKEVEELRVQLEASARNGGGGGGGGGGSARGPALASVEREEYSRQWDMMKDLLVSNGVDVATIAELKKPEAPARRASAMSSGGAGVGGGGGGGGGGGADSEALLEASETIADLSARIRDLQAVVAEHADLAETRLSVEEYERSSRADLDQEFSKLESDKQSFSIERYTILQDRTALEEKEAKIGQLLSNLDDKDSKLRQLLSTLREQQDQWQRAVGDLKKREDLVDEWQQNHRAKEKRLEDVNAGHILKFEQLNAREKAIAEQEAKAKMQGRELTEREQRLQVAISRTSKAEQAAQAADEKLSIKERELIQRERECDIRDREMKSRRRELESWDVLLREKDAKLSETQLNTSEREREIRALEDELRLNLSDYTNNENERKARELEQVNKGNLLRNDQKALQDREKIYAERNNALQLRSLEFEARESQLIEREALVQELMEQVKDLDERETLLSQRVADHKIKENDFFNVRVKQITSRHSKELSVLEDMLTQQLTLVTAFQTELEKARLELSQQTAKSEEYQTTLAQRERLVEQLREELRTFSSRGFGDPLADPMSGLGFGSPGQHMRSSAAHIGNGESKSPGQGQGQGSMAKGGLRPPNPPGSPSRTPGAPPPFGTPHATDAKGSAASLNADSTAAGSAAAGGQSAAASQGKPELAIQLADTQRLIHAILASNASTPSKRAALLRRDNQGAGAGAGVGDTPATTPGKSRREHDAEQAALLQRQQQQLEANEKLRLEQEKEVQQQRQRNQQLEAKLQAAQRQVEEAQRVAAANAATAAAAAAAASAAAASAAAASAAAAAQPAPPAASAQGVVPEQREAYISVAAALLAPMSARDAAVSPLPPLQSLSPTRAVAAVAAVPASASAPTPAPTPTPAAAVTQIPVRDPPLEAVAAAAAAVSPVPVPTSASHAADAVAVGGNSAAAAASSATPASVPQDVSYLSALTPAPAPTPASVSSAVETAPAPNASAAVHLNAAVSAAGQQQGQGFGGDKSSTSSSSSSSSSVLQIRGSSGGGPVVLPLPDAPVVSAPPAAAPEVRTEAYWRQRIAEENAAATAAAAASAAAIIPSAGKEDPTVSASAGAVSVSRADNSQRSGGRGATPAGYAAPLARNSSPPSRGALSTSPGRAGVGVGGAGAAGAGNAYARMHTPIAYALEQEKEKERSRNGDESFSVSLDDRGDRKGATAGKGAIQPRSLASALFSPAGKDGTAASASGGSDSASGSRASTPGKSASSLSSSHAFDIDAPEMRPYIAHGTRHGVPVTKVKAGFGKETRGLMAAAKESSRSFAENANSSSTTLDGDDADER